VSGSPAHSAAERAWIDNALRFVGTLDSDILLTTSGGANVASARRAIASESDVFTMVVAYSLFGDCNRELANAGVPSARARIAVRLLVAACGRLQRASRLFQQAMTRDAAGDLVEAGAASLTAEPLLAQAQGRLEALRER
jgi:hypothetical protein